MADEIIKPKHPGGCPKGVKHKDRFDMDETKKNLAVRSYAIGLKISQVAQILGCSEYILRKACLEDQEFYYRMKMAKQEKTVAMAENVYMKGMGDGPGAIGASIFWLRTQAGWTDAEPTPIQDATTYQKVDMLQGSLDHINDKLFSEGDFKQLADSIESKKQDVDGED
jgi:hypothetical protein